MFQKVIISIGTILMVVFMLSGCISVFKMRSSDSELKESEKLAVSLITTLELRDSQGFRKMFDDSVLNMPEFENGEKYAFEIFYGNLQSISIKSHSSGSRTSNVVDSYTTLDVLCDVITTQNQYMVYIEYFTSHDNVNRINKIIKFKIIETENAAPYSNFADMGAKYGVYYPGWN